MREKLLELAQRMEHEAGNILPTYTEDPDNIDLVNEARGRTLIDVADLIREVLEDG